MNASTLDSVCTGCKNFQESGPNIGFRLARFVVCSSWFKRKVVPRARGTTGSGFGNHLVHTQSVKRYAIGLSH